MVVGMVPAPPPQPPRMPSHAPPPTLLLLLLLLLLPCAAHAPPIPLPLPPAGILTPTARFPHKLTVTSGGAMFSPVAPEGRIESKEAAAKPAAAVVAPTPTPAAAVLGAKLRPLPNRYWQADPLGSSNHRTQATVCRNHSDPQGRQDAAGYLVFESWGAGFNNERMSLELAFLLAVLWGRTLVLPPWAGDYTRMNKQFRYEEYFDLGAMRKGMEDASGGTATVLKADEFITELQKRSLLGTANGTALKLRNRRTFRDKSGAGGFRYFNDLQSSCKVVLQDLDIMNGVIVAEPPGLPPRPPPAIAAGQTPTAARPLAGPDVTSDGWPTLRQFATARRPRRVRVSPQTLREEPVLFIPPGVLLGNYYSVVYVNNRTTAVQAYRTLRAHVRLRDEFFAHAALGVRAINELLLNHSTSGSGSIEDVPLVSAAQPAPWVGFHSRQGDFINAYPHYRLDPSNNIQLSELISAHSGILGGAMAIYYASSSRQHMAGVTMTVANSQEQTVETNLLPALRAALRAPQLTIRWADISHSIPVMFGKDGQVLVEWLSCVELLLCASAPGGFIGSFGSTYTGYIHRLRGWGTAPDENQNKAGVGGGSFLFSRSQNDDDVSIAQREKHREILIAGKHLRSRTVAKQLAEKGPSWATAANVGSVVWAREWPEAFL